MFPNTREGEVKVEYVLEICGMLNFFLACSCAYGMTNVDSIRTIINIRGTDS